MDTIAPVVNIVTLLWSPIGRRIGYLRNLKRKMDDLEKNATILFAQLLEVQEMKNTEQLEVATEECRCWIDDVEKAKGEVDSINAKREEDKICLAGWCPNVKSRMELGKHIEDMIQEMKTLNNRRLAFAGREFRDAPLQRVEPQNFEIHRLQRILKFIEDVKFRTIGIWGMGGIGKTRTLKLLNNRLEKSHLFDVIIWVTVLGEGNRRNVQNEIAERLKCTAIDISDDQLRANIFHYLSKKKFLLILDDIWEKIDLSDVGIPILNHYNECKVLLTTRDLGVCRQMDTDVEIQMERLSKEEAWRLFIEKVGDVAMSPRIEPIARDIVKKCSGFPLAIIVIGSSLRKNSNVDVWKSTLRKLQLPSESQIKGMEKEVFSCLRISYDRLANDCERNLFLYCSLYPEDWRILITELAERCWLEGYIQGVNSIEEARDVGRHMVINLVDASLLERVDNSEEYVKMFDIIRDFALKEASGFFVKSSRHVKEEEKEWLQSQKISLMGCNLVRMLEKPNCSTLSTLLLQYNNQLTIIPDPFFEYMHCLRILDLSGTKIKSLPSSLWNSVYLRGLYLKDCHKLEHLPSEVGVLKRLEVLDLGGSTAIRYLPREVGELEGLKRLIVGFKYRNWSQQNDEDAEEWNMKLRVPSRIIPNLPLLEELSLYVYAFDRPPLRHLERCDCFEKEQWDDENMEVVVDELCRLEFLTYLDAYFPKVEHLEHFLCERESLKASWPRRFRFRVGTEGKSGSLVYHQDGEWDRSFVYKGGLGMPHAAVMETLTHSSFFHLQEHRTARKLSEFGLANMNGLKGCWVIGCDKMETLFDGDNQQETCALLPNLEMLEIENLPELRSLCNGHLLPGSLSKLNYLELNGCNNLKKVLKLNFIGQLCSLKFLSVSNCCTVEEIIEIEEEMEILFDGDNQQETCALLPNLEMLEIENLPELRSLCNGHLLPGSLSKLNYLELNGCNNLKKVLKLNFIGQLRSLKFLSVSNCCTVEEIIEIEEEMPTASNTEIISSDDERVVLPNFQRIRVLNLPELVSICRGFSNLKWPSLESIEIGGCPKLKSLSFLFSHDTNVIAPALNEIVGESDWWEALEWEDNDSKQRLQPFYRGFSFGGTFTELKRILRRNQISNTSNVRSGPLREFAE